MKNILKEFQDFAMRGNVIDLAVAVIIGGVFGKIITSLVNDIIMPPLGLLIGGIDFSEMQVVLKKATGEAPVVAINYGVFINVFIQFVIIAFAIFLIIKVMNSLKKKEEKKENVQEPLQSSEEVVLLREIRDLLKK